MDVYVSGHACDQRQILEPRLPDTQTANATQQQVDNLPYVITRWLYWSSICVRLPNLR